jgi:hypothetical protein
MTLRKAMCAALTAAMLGAVSFGTTACERREGPGEELGEAIDDAGDDLEDAVDPPDNPAEKAGRKIERAVD